MQFFRAAQFRQIDDRSGFMNARAHASHQLGGSQQGATGGDQVVEHEYLVAFAEAVGLYFEKGFAVLGLVALAQHLAWQFALLAEQDQWLVQFIGHDRANQEAARVHGADMAELGFDIALDEAVGDHAQGAWRLQQRGDVTKGHPGLGEVRDWADQGLDTEFVENHRESPAAGWSGRRRLLAGRRPCCGQASRLPPAKAQSSIGSRICTDLPSVSSNWFCWKRVNTRETVSTARPR
ncbi:hypothetical protein D3C85_1225950 [compost metagenome]